MTDLKERIKRLRQLQSLLAPVPPEWAEGHGRPKDHGKELTPIGCQDWSTLVVAWRKALRLRQGLEDVLAVMLAVCLSTEQVGDSQLFLMVIGVPGNAKCLGKGTPVLMLDGSIKRVEDVVVGDRVMGPDSQGRTVLSVSSGLERMYRVVPTKGELHRVNESHVLSLKMSVPRKKKTLNGYSPGQVVNLSVKDYLSGGKFLREKGKLWRTGVEWSVRTVPLEPYFFGLWLGDGSSREQAIGNVDPEVRDYLFDYANRLGMTLTETRPPGKCPILSIVNRKGRKNQVREGLRSLGVLNNKHLPEVYRVNSREVRLGVLAGLIDSDGSVNCGGFGISSKWRGLADDIAFLSRSLGLAAYVSPMECRDQHGNGGTYWRVTISGDCSGVPTKIPRKKTPPRVQVKDVLRTGFQLEDEGVGEYYGFELEGDGLFLLGDFTVTHNTRLCDALLVSRKCVPLEHLKGFYSGYTDSTGEDFSLLARVNRKTLITPEMDVMMGDPNFVKLMSEARRIFDGTGGASYKNRKEDLRYTGLRTPWIAAGTPALLDSDQSRIGDRFLKVYVDRPSADEQRSILMRAGYAELGGVVQTSNGRAEGQMSAEMARAYALTGGYVDYLRGNAAELLSAVQQDAEQVVERCATLAEFTALLRARPNADPRKQEGEVVVELPSRLTKQFVRLAKCLAVVLCRPEIDDDVLRLVRTVALDTARGRTMEIVRHLYNAGAVGLSLAELAGKTHHGQEREGAMLAFLRHPTLGVAQRVQTPKRPGLVPRIHWTLTPRMRQLYQEVVDG